jgi:small subunit ribosomal protein S13
MYFFSQKLNDKKPIKQALNAIFGIGIFLAGSYCKDLGYSSRLRFNKLTKKQQSMLEHKIRNDQRYLKKEALIKASHENVKNLIAIFCYTGLRHKSFLPLRGQRTHTNGKTAKAGRNRVTIF